MARRSHRWTCARRASAEGIRARGWGMALIRCDFFSDVLAVGTSMTVLLPQPTQDQIGVTTVAPQGPPPLLYLLHGLSDDATAWVRQTSIERYAEGLGLAVVMPQVQRSFYCDQVHGGRFWTFMT